MVKHDGSVEAADQEVNSSYLTVDSAPFGKQSPR